MTRKILEKTVHWRLFLVLAIFFVAALLIFVRLFSLQIVNYRELAAIAAKQQGIGGALPRRGTIYFQDKDGKLQAAALNKNLYTISASLKEMEDIETASVSLAEALGVPVNEVYGRLSLGGGYRIIARKIDEATAVKVRALGIKGIGITGESRRVYPSSSLAAHVLGFVQFDQDEETGQYGVERKYDSELSGEIGFLEGTRSSFDYLAGLGKRIVNPSADGRDVVLTVDFNIQKRVEERLTRLSAQWSAESGMITVLDPTTGRILAHAALPTFDPNSPSSVSNLKDFLNPMVEANYELGSVMKPVTMASAVNEGLIDPETHYVDTGEVRIGGYVIRNYDGKANGRQTMTQVLEKSLNTGAVFVEQKLSHKKFAEYLGRFGFGEKTGVDLPGEVRGNISNLSAMRDIDFATASFGQGVAVSPLQVMMAVSAIANGGNLMKPYVVEKVVDQAGAETVGRPEVRRRVLSLETSKTLSRMLVSVTRNGFDNRAGVKGYFVAGKTGTAQIPSESGRGYSDEVIHSFVGYAPAFSPRFLIFIQLNKPRGVNFASTSLSPAFHDLAAYILNYYSVPPDER
ncbi:MAG: penicillin-binding protein 2 [Candidatus Sungbacteria bacterium]|nr:penicillin-binding protein 2 [Candidatus Sungbacteria bacterium]